MKVALFSAALSVWLMALAVNGAASGADAVGYNRDIRPILAENCFRCHGADSAARQAELRLDRREAAIEMQSIVPGKPDESELVRRIFSDDAEERMPPPAAHKELTAAQKELLKRWVAEGAPYEPLWSFIAPQRPALPSVKNTSWPRNPIDLYILARLEERGLAPAAEADRRTLARRLSLDAIGLLPSQAEVQAFVDDPAPDALERYVDRLLSSEHWGEHRARYWLDAARYADTHGLHFDNYREMWSYRDWVIGAFNRNLPFDRFTIEQLAGDLLPNRTLDQQVATGFNRCNITTNEGGSIAEEYLVLYARDRTETASQVFLGLTAGCAVCHDHKFDPISQREFYSLAAFFNNTTQGAMDGNIRNTPPVIQLPLEQDRPRFAALAGETESTRQALDSHRLAARGEFDKWLASAEHTAIAAAVPGDALRLHAGLSEGQGSACRVLLEGETREVPLAADVVWEPGHVSERASSSASGGLLEIAPACDIERDQAFACGAWVKVAKADQSGAIVARMDDQHDYRGWDVWFENGRVGAHIIHKWQTDAIKTVSRTTIPAGEWRHVLVTYDGSGKAAGIKVFFNGEEQPTEQFDYGLKSTVRTEVPFKIGQRHAGQKLAGLTIQDVRFYGRQLEAREAQQLATSTRAAALVGKPAAARSEAESNELFAWWLSAHDAKFQELTAREASLKAEKAAIEARGTQAHVAQERSEAAMAHILFRGDYDKRRDAVTPATLAALPAMPAELPRNRLGLAQWLLLPENPLTARVTVNRFWQEVFGQGIVRTTGDFGVNGETPTHPELLDYLAVEFRESGWDMKRLFRLMLTSATYRQAAVVSADKLEKDPQNRLLSCGPRFRMDAEMIRDSALAASGLLVPKVGGPSVKPYQPEGVWEAVAMIGSDTRDYRRDSGENLYRRSLYTFWKRAAPPAALELFNAPSREFCSVRRERTNTPLQALAMLNDPQLVEAARRLAQTALREGGESVETKIDYIAGRALCRPLRPEEMAVARESLDSLLAHYQAHADDAGKLLAVGESKPDAALEPASLAAWTMLTNQVLNLDEFINK